MSRFIASLALLLCIWLAASLSPLYLCTLVQLGVIQYWSYSQPRREMAKLKKPNPHLRQTPTGRTQPPHRKSRSTFTTTIKSIKKNIVAITCKILPFVASENTKHITKHTAKEKVAPGNRDSGVVIEEVEKDRLRITLTTPPSLSLPQTIEEVAYGIAIPSATTKDIKTRLKATQIAETEGPPKTVNSKENLQIPVIKDGIMVPPKRSKAHERRAKLERECVKRAEQEMDEKQEEKQREIEHQRQIEQRMKEHQEKEQRKLEEVCMATPYRTPTATVGQPSLPIRLKSEKPPSQQITFHLMRHGQATHNIPAIPAAKAIRIHDPPLTPEGMQKCNKFRKDFPHMSNTSVILCSPLQRTMQTAMKSFKPLTEQGHKIILWEPLREWGNIPCNTGTTTATLEKKFKEWPFDTSLLKEGWENNKEEVGNKNVRIRNVSNNLCRLANAVAWGGEWQGIKFEKHEGANIDIVIVSHGGFLAGLVGLKSQDFHNNEYRSYHMKDNANRTVRVHDFIETRESLSRRGATSIIAKAEAKIEPPVATAYATGEETPTKSASPTLVLAATPSGTEGLPPPFDLVPAVVIPFTRSIPQLEFSPPVPKIVVHPPDLILTPGLPQTEITRQQDQSFLSRKLRNEMLGVHDYKSNPNFSRWYTKKIPPRTDWKPRSPTAPLPGLLAPPTSPASTQQAPVSQSKKVQLKAAHLAKKLSLEARTKALRKQEVERAVAEARMKQEKRLHEEKLQERERKRETFIIERSGQLTWWNGEIVVGKKDRMFLEEAREKGWLVEGEKFCGVVVAGRMEAYYCGGNGKKEKERGANMVEEQEKKDKENDVEMNGVKSGASWNWDGLKDQSATWAKTMS